ncbi:aminotransferase class I/II-fold pyridoxal phosphate-dependent enzyme [Collimonas pratensis]|nr:aminotransferase class I/II-fold pyridoxal phosphate-dependent enzyme [Collimonas pratensis]
MPRVSIERNDMHASLKDPVLGAISFLNEIMDHYPNAISFAPGAPYAGFFDEIDVGRYLKRYSQYLTEERRMSKSQIRKRLYQYGPSKGEINGLLADALRLDEGIDVTPESIVVTVGCQEALLLVLKALCSTPNDLLAVVNPCFVGVVGAASVLNVPTVAVNETKDGLDWQDLVRVCHSARAQGQRIRALYVAPDFSNPSGSSLDMECRSRLLEFAETEDFLLLEDNAYGFTASYGNALPTLKSLDKNARVIYFGTCAKICLPGVRVGFVVADQLVVEGTHKYGILADELAALKSMVTVNTSPICQAIVGGMMLEHGGSLAAVGKPKGAFYQRNLGLLLAALERYVGPANGIDRVSWNVPSGGFFVCMTLPVEVNAQLLQDCAAEYGVLWTPMRHFYLDGGGNNQLRLACSYLTADDIDKGIQRLAHFLRDRCAASPVALGNVLS